MPRMMSPSLCIDLSTFYFRIVRSSRRSWSPSSAANRKWVLPIWMRFHLFWIVFLLAQTESGRFWFARYVSAQRTRSKRVSETSFYSLIQHFAIILFECKENDDFAPAKVLMNMCFTYFYEGMTDKSNYWQQKSVQFKPLACHVSSVDVPGCEPYREYLYIYLRYQPIWHALRFWNAAYFDAVQCERNHRPVPQTYSITLPVSESSDDEHSLGSASASQKVAAKVEVDANLLQEDADMQRNICFGQLGWVSVFGVKIFTYRCNWIVFF